MNRFLAMLITTGSLAGAYQAYLIWFLPLTEARATQVVHVPKENTEFRPPAAFQQQAQEYFADAPWTETAEETWQIAEHVSLYFNQHELDQESGNTIRIAPFAVLWRDPKRPEARPYRVLADSAVVKFENAFFDSAIALSDAKPGRIIWASLEGSVLVDGPDGLHIQGQNFYFSEESTQLYSDYPIEFHYGPTPQDAMEVAGAADRMTLSFSPTRESPWGDDMPRVGGLSKLLLSKNVMLDVAFESEGNRRRAHMTSQGSFDYHVAKREATFDSDVNVKHIQQTPDGPLVDTLVCDWLRLQMQQREDAVAAADPDSMNFLDGLEFRQMRALGSKLGRGAPLSVSSQEHDIQGTMQDLMYDAEQRRAVMIDQQQVVIHHGEAKFFCPQIGITHSPDGKIERLDCRGAGGMDILTEELGPAPVSARWSGRVEMAPDPQTSTHQLRLERNAQLSVPNQFGLASDILRLWIDLDRLQEDQPGQRRSEQSGPLAREDFLKRPLPLQRARAEGHVRLNSDLLKVERSNLIDVLIQPGTIAGDGHSTLGQNQKKDKSPDEKQNPWIVQADTLAVQMIHDPSQAAVDVRRVTGKGQVEISHDPGQTMSIGTSKVDGPLVLRGRQLIADNEGGVKQMLTVFGESDTSGQVTDWATVSLGPAQLWGGHIYLTRDQNRLDIQGPGKLSIPISETLDGTQLDEPAALDIVWREGMVFDGQLVRFWGSVTASLPAEQQNVSRLLCEDLSAQLNHRISFVEPESQPEDLTIETLEGKHNVLVEAFEYDGTKLIALRRSELASFSVSQATGDFRGQGPGMLSSWSLGDNVKFSPTDRPQANQPQTTSDQRWQYVNVTFEGQVTGNLQRNEAILSDRVKVITAPVEKASVKFQQNQIDDVSKEAENAVWLGCQQLRIVQREYDGQDKKFSELYATGGTELQGHVFRAVADELTYDERMGRFVLRGLGKEARLYYQPDPSVPASPSAAMVIEFVPAKRKISIDGSTGLSGGF